MDRVQAISFLQNVLKVSQVETKLGTNRLLLLNNILRAFYAHVPYQSIKLLSIDAEKRVAFPQSEYVKDCVATLGGTCHVLNSFMNTLLNALGYKASLQGCKVHIQPSVLYLHLINLVFDVMEEGDIYLVDAGALYPTFEAVPLHNLNGPSKVYPQSYLETKFERQGDTVTRCHRKSKIYFFSKEEIKDEWFNLYYFTLTPASVDVINSNITQTYKERCSGCLRGLSFALYPHGKAVALKNRKLHVYDEATGNVEVKELETLEDIAKELSAYTPGITAQLVEKAMKNAQIEKEFRENNQK